METVMHRKVKFKGEMYWQHEANISPLEHYSEDGELLANPFRDLSYAVVEGDNIMRFQEVIGKVSDLEPVECGFCQGPCKGEHYISQSSEGY